MSGSVIITVTHLLGSGHLVRAAQLARALAGTGFAVTLASGGMPLRPMAGEPFAFLQLPPVRTEGVDFKTLLDEAGAPVTAERMAARIAMLEEAAATTGPDIVITEHFPFGRRQLAREFEALIAAAKGANPRCLVLSSIRDVLVTPKPARIAEAQERIARLFDAVLVHGEETVLPLERSWPVTEELAAKLHYVGYLGAPVASLSVSGEGAGEILVSGGGSAAAVPLFELALGAARLSPGRGWRVLVGRGVDESDFARLSASAPANATVERARADFPALLARCALSISQGGLQHRARPRRRRAARHRGALRCRGGDRAGYPRRGPGPGGHRDLPAARWADAAAPGGGRRRRDRPPGHRRAHPRRRWPAGGCGGETAARPAPLSPPGPEPACPCEGGVAALRIAAPRLSL